MGKKKRVLDVWIFITAIIGASLLVFNDNIADFFNSENALFLWTGIILLILSVIISLSKAWN